MVGEAPFCSGVFGGGHSQAASLEEGTSPYGNFIKEIIGKAADASASAPTKITSRPASADSRAQSSWPVMCEDNDIWQESADCFCPEGSWSTGSSTDLLMPIDTKLPDGEPAALLDIGSWGNVSGDKAALHIAKAAHRAGRKTNQKKRDKPLSIRGVGHGTQTCDFDCTLPVAIPTKAGGTIDGDYIVPIVPDSDLPAIMGLNTCQRLRVIIDCGNHVMHVPGPGKVEMQLPEGTESVDLKTAVSGHYMVPVSAYNQSKPALDQGSLTLTTAVEQSKSSSSNIEIDTEVSPQQPQFPPPMKTFTCDWCGKTGATEGPLFEGISMLRGK